MSARTPTQRHVVVCEAQSDLIKAAFAFVDNRHASAHDTEIYRRRLLNAALYYARIVRLHMRDR